MENDFYEQPAPPEDQGITLEQAREAYVQKNYAAYEKHFKAFDEAGGFRFSFCWPVFFAGILWFLYRKMYIEALALFLILGVLGGVFGVTAPPDSMGMISPEQMERLLAFSLCMSAIEALCARWFYWKAVDRKVERAWDFSNGNPRAALEWLRAKGGVNVWLVAAILGFALMSFFSAVPQ